MGLEYQISVSGTTYSGSTAFLSPETVFSPQENFSLNGSLFVESTTFPSNFETTDINDFDIGLFVGSSGSFAAGILSFATNSVIHTYNGGNFSQTAAIDVVNQSFDPSTGLWRFSIVDESTARGVQLNFYNTSSNIIAAPKPIILGEITLGFSQDLSFVSGSLSLFGGGFIAPTTASYQATFSGNFVQTYQGFSETASGTINVLEASDPNVDSQPPESGGNDSLTGTPRRDVIRGFDGNETILGLGGNDRLLGDAGNDLLVGGTGNDTLLGGTGNDVLDGEAGNDVITAGSGLDRIVLRRRQGFDRIADFQNNQDKIDLVSINFRQLTLQQQRNDVLVKLGGANMLLIEDTNFRFINRADFV